MKKFATGLAALALIVGASTASAQRMPAELGESEGAAPTALLLAAFAAVAAGVVIVTEGGENEIPTSP